MERDDGRVIEGVRGRRPIARGRLGLALDQLFGDFARNLDALQHLARVRNETVNVMARGEKPASEKPFELKLDKMFRRKKSPE